MSVSFNVAEVAGVVEKTLYAQISTGLLLRQLQIRRNGRKKVSDYPGDPLGLVPHDGQRLPNPLREGLPKITGQSV